MRAKPGPRRSGLKSSPKKQADGLWALIVRSKNGGACRYCGNRRGIQAAHIVSRRYKATRYMLENGMPLCHGCHVRFTHAPLEWKDVVESWLPGALAGLEKIARLVVKPDYAMLVLWLKQEAKKRGLETEAIKRRLM